MRTAKFKILFYCWLVYGFFYLNRLNLSPVIPLIISDLGISHARIGLIGASFYVLYTLVQLPVGYLSDMFGARKIIVVGGLISSCANMIFGFGSGLVYLISSQCLNGLGQGCGFSPIVSIIDQHFPVSQRGRALGLVLTSTAVFSVVAFFLSSYIGQTYGWRAVFGTTSLLILPALLFFRLFVSSPPSFKISALEDATECNSIKAIKKESFFEMSKQVFSKNMCLLGLVFFCLCYITYSNLIWLPSFLVESYDVSIVQAGFLAALYPLSGIISRPLGGYISDVVFKGKRKQTIMIGLIVIMLSTGVLSRVENFSINIYLIVMIGFFDNLIGSLFFAWMLDIVPYNRSASGAGMLQFLGHTGTVFAIYFSGIAVDAFHSYRPFFLILSIISSLGLVLVWFISESSKESR